jgi:hypothetical protein
VRNPFTHHQPDSSPEQIDEAYASKGWGVKVERRIPRPAGREPLYFQLRLPNGSAWTDIAELAAAANDQKSAEEAREGQDLLARQTGALGALGQAPGVVLVGAVTHEDDPTKPYHTLSVLYTPLTSLPKSFELSEPEGWDTIRHEQTHVSKHVLRDLLIIARYPERGDDAQSLSTQQYALATDLGSLVMTFNGWGPGSASGRTFGYWDSVAATAYLGEEPAGIVEQIT